MSIPITISKPTSSPVLIGWPGTSNSSNHSASSSVSSTGSSVSGAWAITNSNTHSLSCAFPSWPSRSSLSPPMQPMDTFSSNNNTPSAYISDWDLFEEDLADESQVPWMEEAPAPPRERTVPVPVVMPLLPLFAPEKPIKKRRRSSKKSVRQMGKPMSPIAESSALE